MQRVAEGAKRGFTRAIVFDLYGTLLKIRAHRFSRGVPGLEGVTRREWVSFQREVLLRRPLPTREAFVGAILDRFGGPPGPGVEALKRRLEEELGSVEPVRGARSLVPFLGRRGFLLAVLSNAASLYREPLARSGLDPWFSCVLLSADLGEVKPAPAAYEAVLKELSRREPLEPSEVLFVGDSWGNDVLGPRGMGMRSIFVSEGSNGEPGSVRELSLLGWIDLDTGEPFIPSGTKVTLGARSLTLGPIEPLGDEEQGRYNLVARAVGFREDGENANVFIKRFLLPEACEVEGVGSQLMGKLGLPVCAQAALQVGGERFLVTAEAPGEKLTGPRPELEYARAVGQQAAAAYLLANADLRPRNGFVLFRAGECELTLVDYEHCLLNLAMDLEGVSNPLDRKALEALGRENLRLRVRRRVLADAHMQRAYRAFLGPFGADPRRQEAFAEGWLEVHRRAQANETALREILERRLEQEPSLVVGTHAYRRALTELDLEDFLERLREAPERAVRRCFGEGSKER
jgi:putative hydrolase of the HAD superfamily